MQKVTNSTSGQKSQRSYRRILAAGACALLVGSVSLFAGNNAPNTSGGNQSAQVTTGQGVAVGQVAPDFRLQDQDGKEISLSQYNGKVVVLEWTNPQCPFVQRHYKEGTMKTLAAKYKDQSVVWLAINSTSDDTVGANKKWVADQVLDFPVLDDARGTTGHAYGAKTTPDMFIINKDGHVVYEGAIDNDEQGSMKNGKINFVDRALGEVMAGKDVTTPVTKPYGCHVHYAE